MKTKIIIEIETSKIKKFISDGEDLSDEMEKEWHDKIFNVIENCVQNDDDIDFEKEVFSDWAYSGEYLNPSAKEFSDIGNLMIRIAHEK